jgi:hypothetical protein
MRQLIQIVVLLLLALPANAAWVQRNSQISPTNTANPQQTTAFANALSNPSLIVVAVLRTSTTIATPTDTAGNTYTDCGAGVVLFNGSTFGIELFYALNTKTIPSNVISVANPGGTVMYVQAAEWTGHALSVPVDKTSNTANGNTGTGGGQNMTSGSATTTLPGELVVGLGVDAVGGTITLGTGFSAVYTGIAPMEYLVQSSAGAIAATWHDATNSAAYGAVMATFKPFPCVPSLALLGVGRCG